MSVFGDISTGNLWVQKPVRQLVVCEAAPTKKADSAAKRARQAENRRVYNKSKKSEARTRMKKVMLFCWTKCMLFEELSLCLKDRIQDCG